MEYTTFRKSDGLRRETPQSDTESELLQCDLDSSSSLTLGKATMLNHHKEEGNNNFKLREGGRER